MATESGLGGGVANPSSAHPTQVPRPVGALIPRFVFGTNSPATALAATVAATPTNPPVHRRTGRDGTDALTSRDGARRIDPDSPRGSF